MLLFSDYSFTGGLITFLLYFAFFLSVSGIYALFPQFSGVLERSSISVLKLFSIKLSNRFGDILSSLVANNKAFPLDSNFITSFQDHLRTLDAVYRLLTNRSAFLAQEITLLLAFNRPFPNNLNQDSSLTLIQTFGILTLISSRSI